MGRPSNTETRKRQIALGLMKAMSKFGYSGASIHVIAAEAHISSGLIHYHFKSKQDILVYLIHHLMDVAEKRLCKAPVTNSAIEQLNQLIDVFLLRGKGESAKAVAAWVVIASEAIQHKEVRVAYSMIIKRRLDELELIVAAALKEAGRETENPAEIASGILAIAEGAFQLSCSAPGILTKGFAAKMAKRLIGVRVNISSID